MALTFYSQTLSANGTANNFILDRAVNQANSIIVSINGLVQVPDVDYTVNSTNLNLIITPYASSDIEVRYIELDN